MKKIIVTDKCVKGHTCPMVIHCPAKAIEHIDINKLPTVDNDKCTKCMKCTKIWCGTFKLVEI